MRNTLFDEKIDGTVHLALGNGMPDLGGTNVSRIHWDIVKDLRLPGTRIELDGERRAGGRRWLDLELEQRSLLRRRPVVALLAAEVVSTTGSQMTWLALPWFVLVTTGSATRMSVVVGAELIGLAAARDPRRRRAAPARRVADDAARRRGPRAADARDPGAALGRERRLRADRRARVPARRARGAVLRRAEGDRPGAARRGRGARRPGERALPGRDADHDAARPGARRDPDRGRLGAVGARRRRGAPTSSRRRSSSTLVPRPAPRAADGRGRRRPPRPAVPRARAAPAALDAALRARRHGLDGVLRQRARARRHPLRRRPARSRAGCSPSFGVGAVARATSSPTGSCSSASAG